MIPRRACSCGCSCGRGTTSSGFTIPSAELNLAEGGRYRFHMAPPEGEPFHLSGEFLEIDPPFRLVYTFRWEEPTPDDRDTVVDLSLQTADDGTRLALSQGPFLTEERLELHRGGWTESFEKLQAVLESRG
ncbi:MULTISPECIES: SRPBCC family protein [Micrococcaceae]|uniref:SRPBCC family protein n=1 Tax=Micrococcaceae TaxID=1268 RepID=UPI0024734BA9|nr:SRPBCC domain-containing protein [Arthrobacter sp. PvP023]